MGIKSLLSRMNATDVELVEEYLIESAADRIDKEKGLIPNVKVLGRVSRNGREYSDKAMQQACRMYEGVEVNLNHPTMREASKPRLLSENWGRLSGCHLGSDGVYANLDYLTEHAETPVMLQRIEKGFPVGLSHNASGKTIKRNGKTIVESLTRVHSVDMVGRPATNANLFESEQYKMTTLRELIDSTGYPHTSALLEMMPTEVDPAVAVEAPAEVASPVEAVKVALADEAVRIFLDPAIGPKETGKKVAELAKAAEDVAGKLDPTKEAEPTKEPADNEDPATEPGKENPELDKLKEQVQSLIHRDEVRSVMESHNMTESSIGRDRFSILEAQASSQAMESVIKSWPAHIQSGGLQRSVAQITPLQENIELKPPTTTKNVLARMRR